MQEVFPAARPTHTQAAGTDRSPLHLPLPTAYQGHSPRVLSDAWTPQPLLLITPSGYTGDVCRVTPRLRIFIKSRYDKPSTPPTMVNLLPMFLLGLPIRRLPGSRKRFSWEPSSDGLHWFQSCGFSMAWVQYWDSEHIDSIVTWGDGGLLVPQRTGIP
ncbi:hypothetical protein P280DRAFT_207546 [Massarina eburnea CBS 473.64]|uniref:Uncharacterized protein n=1 Tax=Massarina eburnea CBS 473.64 TaxID=1395130 RepID=A0A6A6RI06_9PLEO|nr:hypothetical protein P280DRAFT_207546 [Massarina eburnea CBS 473.64]